MRRRRPLQARRIPRVPTVVVVDDEADMRDWLRIAIGLEGWDVLEAPDGDAALALLERVEPDVVVIDHRMPGMSGLDLAAALRTLPTQAHLLLFTASVDRQELDRARELGVHTISKVDPKSLFQTLKVMHEESAARRLGAV